ncbi:hypothetical protein [Sphingomonas koreensis]|uniref:hypothetical protein n=1 Tax=Sphingomonas koreensis TaxID=93064 RepID=UPI00234F77C7|nr:hypothetical protein [Sphingomonas koreensis]MDC7810924.1 hypothetical protein [Sphingomonas koreensis]
MAMFQPIGVGPAKGTDRVTAALVAGLEIEFGRGAGAALAQRFLEAEESDFLWEARQSERWLGAYPAQDEEDLELDRVAIVGRLDGRWFVAVSIVDGDGHAQGLMGRRSFRSERQAREAFAAMR